MQAQVIENFYEILVFRLKRNNEINILGGIFDTKQG